VPAVGHVIAPLLVGRDEILALADRRTAEVAAGAGRMLLVSGEAGIGKSRLVGAIVRGARENGFRAASGSLSPQDRGLPAAAFLDLGRSLARVDGYADVAARLVEAITTVPKEGDPARRRLVRDVGTMLADAITAPSVLVLEDLQWADELSLECLTEVARETRERPLLLLADYRTDEPGRQPLLREWRSRMLTQRLAEEVRLERLGIVDTALVTTLILATGLPAPRDIVAAVHARTDGVPLHIEELLGALAAEPGTNSRQILQAAVPETLEDATLARAARLTPAAQEAARAGAAIGRSFSPEALATILEVDPATLDAPLLELVDEHILDGPGPIGLYDFRHQLLRDALYGSIPPRQRRAFHARAATLLTTDGAESIDASLHFERAGMAREAFAAAVSAARVAARLGSHRDAASLYERAVRNLASDEDPAIAAAVREAYGRELAAIDENDSAAVALAEARELYRRAGDVVAAAAVLGMLASVRHLLGDGVDVTEPMLLSGLEELQSVERSVARDHAEGRLLFALAFAYALGLRIDDAEETARRTVALGRSTNDEPIEVGGLSVLANCLPFTGRIAEGLEIGATALARAGEAGLDDDAARIHRWVGAAMSEVFEFEIAEQWLLDGIALSDRADLWNHQNYMTAHLGYVLWATGRWDEAVAAARQAQANGRAGVTTQIAASYVQGYVLLGRGAFNEADARLQESLALAERLGELLRIAFPLWGLAESALLQGDARRAVQLTERVLSLSSAVRDAALLTPSIVTGARARIALRDPTAVTRWLERTRELASARAIPAAELACEHARGLWLVADGSLAPARQALVRARDGWDARHRTWEAAWVRLDLASCLGRMHRWGEATAAIAEAREQGRALGSQPILARADEIDRQARGRGNRGEPWHPLSAREFEVARLVASGLTNAQVAEELGLSPKTVNAHVEHILGKLAVSRRTEIAAWVALVATSAPSPGT
jgi:DNA-binding CsgD family transcriptional regulator/tetratricopeptide (TPR) repeat protein